MRGKALDCIDSCRFRGITPAYAGKRPVDPFQDIIARDHPRLCGEKFEPLQKGYTMTGSPPPMRGKVRVISCKCCGNRITPAYAGKRKKQKGN